MKRTYLFAVALLILFSSTAHAQNSQRRELIQGLLKGLIESQLEQPRQVPQNQPYRPQANPGQRLPSGRPGQSVQGGRPVTIEVSPKMLAARRTLTQWNKASASLVGELRKYEQKSPQLRPLLADSMRFQASLDGLCRRAELSPTIGPLKNDFAVLDRDWRIIRVRFQSTRGIPSSCQGFVTTINDLDRQLCDTFQIQPQVNRVELNRLATTMANDFDHLLRGLLYSSRGQKGGTQLIREGQQLQAKIGQAASLVSRGSYSDLVNAFKSSLKDWRSFSRKVLKLRDQRLKFSIQHIEDNGRLIQEQLFIPIELDRNYLASVTAGLTIESDQLFQNISMADLLKQKNPLRTINQGKEFAAACVKLNKDIESNVAEQDLAWSYLAFSKSWDAVHLSLRDLKNPIVNHRLEDISLTMNSLGEVLGSQTDLSHDQLVHLFSELDALSRQAAFDAHQYITEARYSTSFHNQMCGGFDDLQRQAYAVHRDSVNPTYRVDPKSLQPMFQQWAKLRPLFNQCKGADKNRFANYRQQLEPIMVKLQILYSR